MTKEKIGTEGVPTYYFLTLETAEKAPCFREEPFRTRVEQLWREVLGLCERITGEEYALNDSTLHAVLGFAGPQTMTLLDLAVGYFCALAQDSWGGGELWAAEVRLRQIRDAEELKSLRDFVVQKMLGGEELSELPGLEDDEDEYF